MIGSVGRTSGRRDRFDWPIPNSPSSVSHPAGRKSSSARRLGVVERAIADPWDGLTWRIVPSAHQALHPAGRLVHVCRTLTVNTGRPTRQGAPRIRPMTTAATAPNDPHLITPAALEFLDKVLGLAGTMAPHTRHARFLDAAATSALGGLIDGLDVYYRRLRDLIDPASTAPSEAHKNREWLDAFLGGCPLTAEQVGFNGLLKDVRNLSVHNNGRVDEKFMRRWGHLGHATLGEPFPVQLYAALAAPALQMTVTTYDALVLQQAPHLGIPFSLDRQRKLGAVYEELEDMIGATREEWTTVTDSIEHFNASPLPYTFAGVDARYSQQGFGHRWLDHETELGLYAFSRRMAIAGPFADEAALGAWLRGPRIPADQIARQCTDEHGWLSVDTRDGPSVYVHPDDFPDLFDGPKSIGG